MARRNDDKKIAVDSYIHNDKKRTNNPPVGLVSEATDHISTTATKYEHDPHIDPYLSWAGKKEGTSFDVPDVSLHVHERIDPKRIIKSFLKKEDLPQQPSLFEEADNELPLQKAFDFYHHSQDWTNRLIAGDSLLVMNSLLQKEGMAGKVQMIYIDPPYGIKYNSNFQPFVNKRDVKDNNDADIPAEPEMIQAFRDTWELGVHSYLNHLRDRLLLSKELLHDTGSVFVQISDENLHLVRNLLDEVFGTNNHCGTISFKKTSGQASSLLAGVCDYIVWYGKDKKQIKYHQLYNSLGQDISDSSYNCIEFADGSWRRLTAAERRGEVVAPEGRRFRTANLTSQGTSVEGSAPFEFRGKIYRPSAGNHWKPSRTGLETLANKGRLIAIGNTLAFKRYLDDFPAVAMNNIWSDTIESTFAAQKLYVVQTATKVIQRCLLMTTDPGDLVLDPTCGSGTTALVAEQWGRRWITCDTSRVALALAKQRQMTSRFDYYELSYKDEGISSGLKYKEVNRVTLGSLANNEPSERVTLYDQVYTAKNKIRVTGPFTVEAVPSLRTKPFDGSELNFKRTGLDIARTGETGNQALWRDELKATGIRTVGGKMINFSRIEPFEGSHFIHAIAVIEEGGVNRTAVISFGPDYGPIEQRQVEEVITEARSLNNKLDFVIFAAFQFDPEAAKDIDQIDWPGVQLLKAQMSVDLLTGDLRKKRSSNQSYWLIGQPDIDLIKNQDGRYQVKVNGFDYYNPVTGEIDSGNTKRVAAWYLDTDYDERSIFPSQVFFPASNSKRDWTKLVKALNGAVDPDLVEAFVGTESLPFNAGEHRRCAVKIIDDRGIESFVIKELT